MITFPKKNKTVKCPYCYSKNIAENEDLKEIECLDCHEKWIRGLEWLHKGMKIWLNNIQGCYSALSRKKKKKYKEIIESFGKKWSSSYKLHKEDPISSMNLLLHAMEELMVAFALVFHKILPKYFSKSHEVKMTPHFDYLPKEYLGKNEKDDEIYLFIDFSGKYLKPLHLSESEFWNKEENHKWNSISERYGVMFRDGRYYRSKKWEEFCKKECLQIVNILRYSGYLLDYIEKKDKILGRFFITEEGNILIICSVRKLDEYWTQRKNDNQ